MAMNEIYDKYLKFPKASMVDDLMKASGRNPDYDEVRGLRYNSDKLRYDLIPPLANRECAKVWTESLGKGYAMTYEEKKAKRAAYMVKWRANLSRFQKEKRRSKENEYRKKARIKWTPEQLEKSRELNRTYYLKNKDKLLANMAIYRKNKKKESC